MPWAVELATLRDGRGQEALRETVVLLEIGLGEWIRGLSCIGGVHREVLVLLPQRRRLERLIRVSDLDAGGLEALLQ